MSEKNPFLYHADKYFLHRPTYPQEWYYYLAGLVDGDEQVVDCATGNGQAALGLSDHFDRVFAIDSSATQIANAFKIENVTYRVSSAENIDLPDGSVDLVTAAQGVHWFDLKKFYTEVNRVLKKDGVIAVWSYSGSSISPELDDILDYLAKDILGPYWEPVIKEVFAKYKNLPFPFQEITGPEIVIKREWPLDELLNYLQTWSAIPKYLKANGKDPLEEILPQLQQAWGKKTDPRLITWPIHYRIGRKK